MKSRLLFLGILILNTSACLKTKTEQQSTYSLAAGENLELSQKCEEMYSKGDLMLLLETIKKNTDRIFYLLGQKNIIRNEPEISALADKVSFDTSKVKEISKPEWTNNKFERHISWRIDQSDFDVLNIQTGVRFSKVNLIGVYLTGNKRSDLEKNISFSKYKNRIEINYSSKASALELCQLEKTLMVVIEVSNKNMLRNVVRYFNLIVQK